MTLFQFIFGRKEVAGLCQEIRELSRLFSGFNLSFVNREGNKVVHLCASLASLENPIKPWLNVFPTCLVRVAETDCKPVPT
jgi:hypothetical protein